MLFGSGVSKKKNWL